MTTPRGNIKPYLERIRALPFVENLEFSAAEMSAQSGIDGVLKLHTPRGSHLFYVETKRSYLDTGLLHALIAEGKSFRDRHNKQLLVFARYIPAPPAQKLIESGINFLDDAGNMHLTVGKSYERTVLGQKEKTQQKRGSRLTAAVAQLLFSFADKPEAVNWTVREIADLSGVGKSSVAKVREQLLDEGLLRKSNAGFEIADHSELHDQLLQGYELALRPKLLLGRFRSHGDKQENMLESLRTSFAECSLKWSLTGGPAAYALQRFYRGSDTPIFLERLPEKLHRRLRLLPDRTGPLIFLRSFGTLPFWKEVEGTMIAHPWLIYAELMHSKDTRAHEAAHELKNQYLNATNA